jgi:hypothetical protein
MLLLLVATVECRVPVAQVALLQVVQLAVPVVLQLLRLQLVVPHMLVDSWVFTELLLHLREAELLIHIQRVL